MALFIQSANALVSRVAQWVGAIPSSISINATAFVQSTGVITCSSSALAVISIGDFIGPSLIGSFTAVLGVTSTTITVSDPDGVWTNVTLPTAIMKIPSASSLEIQSCVQMAELKMRTIELPALRSDPYSDSNPTVLTTNANGMAPIPADMSFPILFFQESPPSDQPQGATSLGPWIVYDRVGDREIIRRRMIDQLYIRPFGVPRVIRLRFLKSAQTISLHQILVLT